MGCGNLRSAAVLVALAIEGAVGLPATRGADVKPEAAVGLLLKQQVSDWNRGDLDAFLSGYWRSPDLVFQSGADRSAGWDSIRDRYRKRYQAEGREMGSLEFTEVEIVPLGAESALARGRWKLSMANGTSPAGLFTLILRKLPEGWKIVHDHTSGG